MGLSGNCFSGSTEHECKTLPAAGKHKPFARAAPPKAAEQLLFRLSGPGVLEDLGLVPLWQQMLLLSHGDTEAALPTDSRGLGVLYSGL